MQTNRVSPSSMLVLSQRFRSIEVNPLTLVSALMLAISPFLNWMTELGFAVIVPGKLVFPLFSQQPTLWDFAAGRAGIDTISIMPLLSLASGVIILIGALASLRWSKVGPLLAGISLAVFMTASLPFYRSSTVNTTTLIIVSPGLGPVVAFVALVLAGLSFSLKSQRVEDLWVRLRTSEGLARTGLFVASVPLVLDGLNHFALGQLSAFIGVTLVEELLHVGFLLSLTALLLFYGFRRRLFGEQWPLRLIGMAFVFLLFDGAYHTLAPNAGGLLVFFGHNAAEATLHILTYYGVALSIIALYLWKRE